MTDFLSYGIFGKTFLLWLTFPNWYTNLTMSYENVAFCEAYSRIIIYAVMHQFHREKKKSGIKATGVGKLERPK